MDFKIGSLFGLVMLILCAAVATAPQGSSRAIVTVTIAARPTPTRVDAPVPAIDTQQLRDALIRLGDAVQSKGLLLVKAAAMLIESDEPAPFVDTSDAFSTFAAIDAMPERELCRSEPNDEPIAAIACWSDIDDGCGATMP